MIRMDSTTLALISTVTINNYYDMYDGDHEQKVKKIREIRDVISRIGPIENPSPSHIISSGRGTKFSCASTRVLAMYCSAFYSMIPQRLSDEDYEKYMHMLYEVFMQSDGTDVESYIHYMVEVYPDDVGLHYIFGVVAASMMVLSPATILDKEDAMKALSIRKNVDGYIVGSIRGKRDPEEEVFGYA